MIPGRLKKLILKGFAFAAFVLTIGIASAFASGGIKSAAFTASKLYVEGKEIQMKNPLAAVVKSGESDAATYAPVRELMEALGYTVKWDETDNSVYISQKVISEPLELEGKAFPLIAKASESNTCLYAVGLNQAVLQHNGISKAFNWVWTTPRFVMPRMCVFDYDGDKVSEIAVSMNYGSGTGLSLDGLHIVKPDGEDFIDFFYSPEEYCADISKALSYEVSSVNGKTTAKFSVGDSTAAADLSAYASEISACAQDFRLALGNIIEFTPRADGTIGLTAGLGVNTDINIDPIYFAEFRAEVIFNDTGFEISGANVDKR